MGRKSIDFEGYENEWSTVIRRASGEEVPHYAGRQQYWVVECKTCGNVRVVKGSRVALVKACAHCNLAKRNASREETLRAEAITAWDNIKQAVTTYNIDVIERAVTVLRWYESHLKDNSR